MPFHFHHQPSSKHEEAQNFPSPKQLWLEETLQWDADTSLTGKISAPPYWRPASLLLSTVFATRCQVFAVSSSGKVSHEYAKRRDCQAAKSWSRAELVQHSPSLLWRSKLLLVKVHVILFFFYTRRVLRSLQIKRSKECCYLLHSCCDIALSIAVFNLMINPFANMAPQGHNCAWRMSFWQNHI